MRRFCFPCVVASTIVLSLTPVLANAGSLEEIPELIRQKKGKEARQIIDAQLKSEPDDETAFRLQILRAESLIADESLSAADAFADARARFKKIDRQKYTGEFDRLRGELNAFAMSNFLKVISLDNRWQTKEAAALWKTTQDKLGQFLDDRGQLAEKIAHCRLLINFDHERMASIILRAEMDDIPDVIQKYRNSLKQDELLTKCIMAVYLAMIRASVRMDDFKGVEKVKKKMFSVINAKLHPAIDEWVDSEITRRKTLLSLSPSVRPILKQTVEAINSDNAQALQSCIWPGSDLYAAAPGMLKSITISIDECKPLDVSSRTTATPRENDRIWVWVYLSKTLTYKKDEEAYDRAFPDQTATLRSYVITGPEWVSFRFDGNAWKIEQFNFDAVQMSSLSFGKEAIQIR